MPINPPTSKSTKTDELITSIRKSSNVAFATRNHTLQTSAGTTRKITTTLKTHAHTLMAAGAAVASTTTEGAPTPIQGKVQAPPTYKDLFPSLFRTFSLPDDHTNVSLPSSSPSNSRNDNEVREKGNLKCLKIFIILLVGCIVFLIVLRRTLT